MTGAWMLAAAVLALPAGWFLVGRPLAASWGGRWWGKGHGRRAALRELRSPEAAAGIWPGGTGWMLPIRISAGAGGLWLLWPAGAAAGGRAGALIWLLGVWLLLFPVRDHTILYASVRSAQAGRQVPRLALLLGWVFSVLALAVLGGWAADALQSAWPSPAAGPGAVTAAVLVSCEAVSLGVILQYAGLRRTLRTLLLVGMPLAALAVGLACPVVLGGRLLLVLVLFSAFCAAAAPSWVLSRPRAALCGTLLALCLAAGILTAGLAAVSPAAQPADMPAFAPGGFWALLFAAGGGAAAGLQTVAAGCTANNLVRPEDFAAAAHPAPRQERAVFAVGFGGMLMIGLLAAAALAVYCTGPAGQNGGAAGYAAALSAQLARFGLPAGPAAKLTKLLYMAAALPVLCGLDAAAAAGRSALQGIFGSASLPPQRLAPWRKLLRSRPAASLFTVLPALFLAGSANALLPLLDGLGWLLSGLALLLALAAHRQAGRRAGWLWPLAAALLLAGWLSLGRHAAWAMQNAAPAAAGAAGALMLAALWAAAGAAGRLWKGQNAKKAARRPLAENAAETGGPPKGA